MAIKALHVGNFKGIATAERIEIKPITLFIGPNSSGKSSCIHALASLSQTVKLPNDTRSLSLDDEFASVHLGRFIEVIHSRSYSGEILLGIELTGLRYTGFEKTLDNRYLFRNEEGDVRAEYAFKCSKRTQEVYLDTARHNIGTLNFRAQRAGDKYEVTEETGKTMAMLSLERGFLFDQSGTLTGGNLDAYYQFAPLFSLQSAVQSELQNTLYLGPFRQGPLRRYPTRGSSPTEVGALGEATTSLLANEIVQSRSRSHIRQIARWLGQLGLAKRLVISRVAKSDLFDVTLTLPDGDSFPIADLGYGLSQILPVLTQCSFAPAGSTLLFEQPELHLHSLAARPLAKVFIETASSKNIHIVAETHSPELFKQFLCELRDGKLPLSDFVAYRVSRQGQKTVVTKIEIDPDGIDVYEQWEAGLSVP